MIFGPAPTLDGSIRPLAYTFLEKLRDDDTAPGLHIEPINGTVDPRIRTGRVNKFWRAVLVKVKGQATEAHYIYLGTYPHDDAISFAKTARVRVNPATGIAELIKADQESSPQVYEHTTTLRRAPEPAPPRGSSFFPESSQPLLAAKRVAMSDLLGLGLDASLAADAISATTEDELIEIAASGPAEWQGQAILELAAGTSIRDVRTMYSLDPVVGDVDSDESLLTALNHPAARMEFAYIEDDEVLRAAIEDDDFGRWRVFLHPEQQDYAFRDRRGSFRLSGGAGTGKTVVLLHRARHLARQNPHARIILTTYNKTLAQSLRDNLLTLDRSVRLAAEPGGEGVHITTVDAIAWRLLNRYREFGLPRAEAVATSIGARSTDVVPVTSANAWTTALRTAGWELADSLRQPGFLAAEYATVILPSRVMNLDHYQALARPGRGVALDKSKRTAIWQVVEAYRAVAAKAGTTDYDEKALIAATSLDLAERAGAARLADHVLVDETQDLMPARLILLRALAADGPNDLFIADDAHQRIYSPKVVLSKHGIDIRGRSRRLTLNYRTTAQNLRFGTSVLSGEELVDLEELEPTRVGYRSSRTGPAPAMAGYPSLDSAYDAAAATISGWLDVGTAPGAIGVLVRSGDEGTHLVDGLARRGTATRYISAKDVAQPGNVQVMTMHRCKGMEFKHVLLFGVSAEAMPARANSLPEGDRADAMQRERSLLYVAATRARDELVVMWDGQRSALLPEPV
ncbi:UvrD-helicase domain-containing protein [Xylanimonas cellulosilytica]|uniref:UvrD-helicase domain-containing protein n=1 Tax=Xylanimonas cellulosilytica TaxID=186189 RepID=UPI00019C070A|nr:UvrD-helicase domain-containing protein [Xylanimonas cellulosilytica]